MLDWNGNKVRLDFYYRQTTEGMHLFIVRLLR